MENKAKYNVSIVFTDFSEEVYSATQLDQDHESITIRDTDGDLIILPKANVREIRIKTL